jgi:hypothetical protein
MSVNLGQGLTREAYMRLVLSRPVTDPVRGARLNIRDSVRVVKPGFAVGGVVDVPVSAAEQKRRERARKLSVDTD